METASWKWIFSQQMTACCHGYSTCEDTIIVLRMFKAELLRVGGVLEFPITCELLDSVSAFWSKYEADRLARLQA